MFLNPSMQGVKKVKEKLHPKVNTNDVSVRDTEQQSNDKTTHPSYNHIMIAKEMLYRHLKTKQVTTHTHVGDGLR